MGEIVARQKKGIGKNGKWKYLLKIGRINGPGAQAKIFSQSSSIVYCQSRGICLDIINVFLGQCNLKEGHTISTSQIDK